MKKISIIWLVAGIALLIWTVIGLWQIGNNKYLGISSGAFVATLLGLSFYVLCIVGARGLMVKKTWGRKIIVAISYISVIYSAVYLFGGGFEDTSSLYAIAVLGLFLLGIISLAMTRKKKFADWQLTKAIEADRD